MVTLTPEECLQQRSALGLSAERLATLAGLAERTVKKFEAGSVHARIGTVLALRNGLLDVHEASREC